jgi:hemerythrin-like metal-binding protein
MLGQFTFSRLLQPKVGDIIDRDHVQITRKNQNLRTAILNGLGMDLIISCSKKLIVATAIHFKSEERAMDASPQKLISNHKLLHAEMMESLDVISADLEQRRINGALELIKFFEGRLAYHLDVEDAVLEQELKG